MSTTDPQYSRGYSKGYQAGLRAAWAIVNASRPRQPEPTDPIQRMGYLATEKNDSRNPYQEGSDNYYRWNQGVHIFHGTLTATRMKLSPR